MNKAGSSPASGLDSIGTPDEELIERFRAGIEREASATQLFGRYQRRVYLWCLRMVRDHDRALDLAQESQLKAFRGLDGFREEARFSSWLFAIVRNVCLSDLRPVRLTRDPDFDLESLATPAVDADARLIEFEDENALWNLVDECLEADEREALMLRCFERVPVEEISQRLGLENRTGARALLQKARRKLRAEM